MTPQVGARPTSSYSSSHNFKKGRFGNVEVVKKSHPYMQSTPGVALSTMEQRSETDFANQNLRIKPNIGNRRNRI